MSRYVTVYTTVAGFPVFEETQEYPDAESAIFDAYRQFYMTDPKGNRVKDDRGNEIKVPVLVTTQDGHLVLLQDYDSISVLTEQEYQIFREAEG